MQGDPRRLRIDGIYQQAGENRFMQRIKVPGGALGAVQAKEVASLAEQFAGGRLHLTSRGSIELHDVGSEDLAEIARRLALVGLTGRGACGGAVRGISCSTTFSPHYAVCQALARRLHRHFAGHPGFEGLPKKFKIGVEGDPLGGRHLIQDVGLVYAGEKEERQLWDVWCAGGLGREPQAGFLLGERIPEERIIPLVEGVLRVYAALAEPGRRLKHVLNRIGEAEFRDLLRQRTGDLYPPQVDNRLGSVLMAGAVDIPAVVVPVFAGELRTVQLAQLAQLAALHGGGALLLTADQDVAFFPVSSAAAELLCDRLREAEFSPTSVAGNRPFRVCPGSHECRMGLAPTRDLAAEISALLPDGPSMSCAVSGCPNSCSQPQLAGVGVVSARQVKDGEVRQPRFQLWRRDSDGLGRLEADDLSRTELLNSIARLAKEFEPSAKGE